MNKMTAYQKAKFLENIDSIFNISKCQHKFRSCLESDCTTVSCKIKDLHLDCTCLPVDKVPKEERAFMQDQKLRRKQGDKGKYQMSIVNRRQAKRDERALEKRGDIDSIEPQVDEVIEEVCEDNSVVMEDINQNESESDENKSDTSAEYKDDAVSRLERMKKQNWIPLTNLAREADRYGLGNTQF